MSDDHLSRYFDNSLDDKSIEQLLVDLEDCHEDRAEFIRLALLHYDLHEVMREQDIEAFLQDALDSMGGSRSENLVANTTRKKYSRSRRRLVALTAIAAALVLWIGSSLLPTSTPSETFDGEDHVASQLPESDSRKRQPIGTMVFLQDCVWSEESLSPAYGDLLREGSELSLETGAAAIAFENGVRLVIKGATKLLLESDMKVKVLQGVATARVPNGATGFTLITPSSEVIDLGTQFGVSVDSSGKTEVLVFEGEVISRWSDPESLEYGKSFRLRETGAASYSPDIKQGTRITADESKYLRDLAPRLQATEIPPLPIKEDLALWLSAGHLVEVDAVGRVERWGDLVCQEGQLFDIAFQVDELSRPEFVQSAINGFPALRFDGVDDHLITTPLATTSDQSIFVVFQCNDTKKFRGQLLNYNGPPHRKLQYPTGPGVMQLNVRRFSSKKLRMSGLVHSGTTKGYFAAEGRAFAEFEEAETKPGMPIVLCYCYDTTSDRATLSINAEVAAKSDAPWPAGLISRKVIGRHGYVANQRTFRGDIAEIIIYNQALSSDEVLKVNSYLMDRYGANELDPL